MYYVCVLLGFLSAFFTARMLVAISARIKLRYLRRILFWFILFPATFTACCLFFANAEDTDPFAWTSYVIWLLSLWGGLLLSLWVVGLVGFRRIGEDKIPRGASWKIGRNLTYGIASVVLMLAAIALFERQLQWQLTDLKNDAINRWEETKKPQPDPKLREEAFAGLSKNRAAIEAWPEGLIEKRIRDIDVTEERFANLGGELGDAFALLRADAPHLEAMIASIDANSLDELDEDDPERSLLAKTISLYEMHVLARASQGEVTEAIDDLAKLQRFAKACAASASYDWSFLSSNAYASLFDCVERLLMIAPEADEPALRQLIDESFEMRRVHPEVLAVTGAKFIQETCDFYLGIVDPKLSDDPVVSELKRLPRGAVYLSFAESRLKRARDEMIAMRQATSAHDDLRKRFDDPTATSDELIARREAIPIAGLARFDIRDLVYYARCHCYGRQQVVNTAIAATLYQRQHGEYPELLDQLVPEYLSQTPRDADSGKPLRIRRIFGGLVISGGSDGESILEQDESRFNRSFTKWLSSTMFLGPVYQRLYGEIPPDEPEDQGDSLGLFDDEEMTELIDLE